MKKRTLKLILIGAGIVMTAAFAGVVILIINLLK
jgi:hypothetical protein